MIALGRKAGRQDMKRMIIETALERRVLKGIIVG